MKPDAQRDACPVADTSSQDAKSAKYISMYEFRFCRIFRFLEQFFYPWHASTFLGLLYHVPDKDMKVSLFIKR